MRITKEKLQKTRPQVEDEIQKGKQFPTLKEQMKYINWAANLLSFNDIYDEMKVYAMIYFIVGEENIKLIENHYNNGCDNIPNDILYHIPTKKHLNTSSL